MDNVEVLVEDLPPPDEPDLLGLYQGIPPGPSARTIPGSLPDQSRSTAPDRERGRAMTTRSSAPSSRKRWCTRSLIISGSATNGSKGSDGTDVRVELPIDDERTMRLALEQAERCLDSRRRPRRRRGRTRGRGRFPRRATRGSCMQDPTAHAEILALRAAAAASVRGVSRAARSRSPWSRARCAPAPPCCRGSTASCSARAIRRRGSRDRWATSCRTRA